MMSLLATAATLSSSFAPSPLDFGAVHAEIPVLERVQPNTSRRWSTAQFPLEGFLPPASDIGMRASADIVPLVRSQEALWGDVEAAVGRWAKLGEDWDMDGAPVPSQVALRHARQFLKQAQAAAVSVPEPFITSDVELGFRWRKDDGFAAVSFDEAGHLIAFSRAPGSEDALRMDTPFLEQDLSPLFAEIRRLA